MPRHNDVRRPSRLSRHSLLSAASAIRASPITCCPYATKKLLGEALTFAAMVRGPTLLRLSSGPFLAICYHYATFYAQRGATHRPPAELGQ
eukprot:565681-Pyramimonas_sp.AAC.1